MTVGENIGRQEFERMQALREARLDERQAKCVHEWEHAWGVIGSRGYSSTWCRKCKISAFAYERGKRQSTGERQTA